MEQLRKDWTKPYIIIVALALSFDLLFEEDRNEMIDAWLQIEWHSCLYAAIIFMLLLGIHSSITKLTNTTPLEAPTWYKKTINAPVSGHPLTAFIFFTLVWVTLPDSDLDNKAHLFIFLNFGLVCWLLFALWKFSTREVLLCITSVCMLNGMWWFIGLYETMNVLYVLIAVFGIFVSAFFLFATFAGVHKVS